MSRKKKQEKLATPVEVLANLPAFEGLPTVEVSLEVRGIEGGFNDGLTIDPIVLHKGDRVFLLVEGEVDAILHKSVHEDGGWRRAHVVRVSAGTIVDEDFATDRLELQARRIEEARGVQRLPFDELTEAHDNGDHASGLVDGCPQCDDEVAAMEAERAEALVSS